MKKSLVLLPALALVLAGAGCTASTNVDVDTNGDTATMPADSSGDNTWDDTGTTGDDATIDLDTGVSIDTGDDDGTADQGGGNDDTTAEVRTFTVTGSNFAFSPSSMTVKKGDTVNITFVNSTGTHDFRIDEYGIATLMLENGASQTVSFVADKAGTFEYYCSVGSHRAMGMQGTLTVTE